MVLGVVPSCFLLLLVRVLGCLRCFLLSLSTGACEDPLVFVLGTGGEVAGAPGAVASAGLPLVCAVGLCPVPRTPSERQRDQKVSGGDQKGCNTNRKPYRCCICCCYRRDNPSWVPRCRRQAVCDLHHLLRAFAAVPDGPLACAGRHTAGSSCSPHIGRPSSCQDLRQQEEQRQEDSRCCTSAKGENE